MKRTTLALAAVLTAPIVVLTACGGDASPSTTADAASPAATLTAPSGAAGGGDFQAYRDCMAENGVTLPEFGTGNGPQNGRPTGAPPSGAPGQGQPFALPDGVDQQAFDAAQAACADLRPAFGQGGPGGSGIDESALVAFRSCMADNGIDVSADQNPFRDLDRSDPDVQAAFDTCAPLLPEPGSGAEQQ